jgi:hypothetical protein
MKPSFADGNSDMSNNYRSCINVKITASDRNQEQQIEYISTIVQYEHEKRYPLIKYFAPGT